jgi:hypothetical protein
MFNNNNNNNKKNKREKRWKCERVGWRKAKNVRSVCRKFKITKSQNSFFLVFF